jgi:taurine dioxygenase
MAALAGERGHVLAKDHDFVSNVGPEAVAGTSALPFHSDYAFLPEPVALLSLHAVDVVDDVSATRFCSGRRAYETMPAALRDRVAGLKTLNVMPLKIDERNRASEMPPGSPSFERPVVVPHATTGAPSVSLSWLNVDCLVGLEPDESEALLEELAAHVYASGNVHEHPWRNGDVVIWDNLAMMHSRNDMSNVGTRVLQRASVGKYHFYDLYPDWRREQPEKFDAATAG